MGPDNELAKVGVVYTGTGGTFILDFLGFTSWAEFAGFCTAVFTLILIIEKIIGWLRKRWSSKRRA